MIGRMAEHSPSRAGQPAEPRDLVDVAPLVTAYYTGRPDPADAEQQVAFGTSGHRGSSLDRRSTRRTSWPPPRRSASTGAQQGYDGPLFLGRDTHGLSEPAWATALEVLAANDVTVLVDAATGYTPTPARLARDPARQPRRADQDAGPGRRHRRHPVAQPAPRRRLQVQPAARRPGRQRRHRR